MTLATSQRAKAVRYSGRLNDLALVFFLRCCFYFGGMAFFKLLRRLLTSDPAFNVMLENIQRDRAGLQHTVVKYENIKVFI